jgi:hypothetical protein
MSATGNEFALYDTVKLALELNLSEINLAHS